MIATIYFNKHLDLSDNKKQEITDALKSSVKKLEHKGIYIQSVVLSNDIIKCEFDLGPITADDSSWFEYLLMDYYSYTDIAEHFNPYILQETCNRKGNSLQINVIAKADPEFLTYLDKNGLGDMINNRKVEDDKVHFKESINLQYMINEYFFFSLESLYDEVFKFIDPDKVDVSL